MVRNNWLIFDAMWVIFEVWDDTNDLLVPFIQKRNSTISKEEINKTYLKASLWEITSFDFWKILWFEKEYPQIEIEYLDKNLKLDNDFIKTAKELSKHFKLWILSNDVSEWSKYLRNKFKLNDLFDVVVISWDVKTRKPDKKIYEILLENTWSKSEIYFVDDRWKNLKTAKELWIKTVKFNRDNKKDDFIPNYNISSFNELKWLLINKFSIFDKIISGINSKKHNNKPFVVWINWIDWSWKTEFTKQLNNYLIQKWFKTQIIHLDDFHNPQAIRYAWDVPEYKKYFNQSFSCETIEKELLEPISNWKEVKKELKLMNLETDKYDLKKEYDIDSDTIVLFEWVFLFRDEFVDYLDYKVLIDIPFALSKIRANIRNPELTNDDLKSYDIKYIPAQERYFKKCKPKYRADLVINNEDFNNPKIVKT